MDFLFGLIAGLSAGMVICIGVLHIILIKRMDKF